MCGAGWVRRDHAPWCADTKAWVTDPAEYTKWLAVQPPEIQGW